MRKTTAAALALAAVALAGAAFVMSRGGDASPAPVATAAPAVPVQVAYLPPCATEDSTTDCIWLADQRGNGRGRSFIVYSGRTWYLAQGETPAPSVTGAADQSAGIDIEVPSPVQQAGVLPGAAAPQPAPQPAPAPRREAGQPFAAATTAGPAAPSTCTTPVAPAAGPTPTGGTK